MVTYPIAAIFRVFGPGEIQASLWGLLCSLLSVLVVYRLGVVLHGRSVGLMAALLCAFYPLEVVNGTRILSDVQVGLFSSLALLCFTEATLRPRPMMYMLAGAAAGGAYLANGRGLIVAAALLGVAMLLAAFRKAAPLAWVWIGGGFLAVFSAEALLYSMTTGDALFSYHIQSGASYFKYLHEPVSSFSLGRLHVEYTNGRPFDLLRTVFLVDRYPTDQFGLFFFLFAAATLFSLIRRSNLLLAGLAIGLFLYLEFGPLRLSIDWPRGEVHYMMVFKQPRFLLMLTAPLVVMAAYFLCAVSRARPIAGVLLTTGLCITALSATAYTRHYYRAGLSDLRAAAEDVRLNSGKMFFGDLWAILHLQIFSGQRAQNLAVLSAGDTLDKVRHGCVMLGGSRGVELLADYVEGSLPVFARAVLDTGMAPDGWEIMREIKGERSPLRRRDFRIYCVP
jgi:4-amino-4-deoxy-L-arabinose transferase-like glycosyltransferase